MYVYESNKYIYISEKYKNAEFALFYCNPRDGHGHEGTYRAYHISDQMGYVLVK